MSISICTYVQVYAAYMYINIQFERYKMPKKRMKVTIEMYLCEWFSVKIEMMQQRHSKLV